MENDNLPEKIDVVEAEVVEPGDRQRQEEAQFRAYGLKQEKVGFFSRIAVSLVLLILGAVMLLIGLVLTVTVIGAFLGVPLMVIGGIMVIAALFMPLSKITRLQ